MYTLTYNGFTLQNDSNHTINKLDGISRVPMRVSSDVLTGSDGGNIWERMLDMRPITVGGYIYSDSASDYYAYRSALLSAFSKASSGVLSITRSDGVTRSINAKVIDIPLFIEEEGDYSVAQYEILLKAEDPLFYDSINTYSMVLGTGGGFPVPMTVPSPVGGTNGDMAIITNAGDSSGYASFVVTGPMVNPTITNTTTGKYFSITYSLNAGDTISIYKDTRGFFCLLNDTTSLIAYLDGEFFPIVTGSNVLKLTGVSGTGNVVASFASKFSGI